MSEHEGEFVPPRPWSLAPLKGKFYGTSIMDAHGNTVCEVWLCAGPPSPREDIDPAVVSDSHYESMATYETATLICDLVNAAPSGGSVPPPLSTRTRFLSPKGTRHE